MQQIQVLTCSRDFALRRLKILWSPLGGGVIGCYASLHSTPFPCRIPSKAQLRFRERREGRHSLHMLKSVFFLVWSLNVMCVNRIWFLHQQQL